MRTMTLVAAVVAAMTLTAVPTYADSKEGPKSKTGKAASLHDTMEDMGKTYAAISEQIKDKSKADATVKLVGELQRHVLVAKGLTPGEKHLVGDKAKAMVTYRTMMLNLLRELLSLEEQLIQGKTDDAVDTWGGIKKIMEQGHKDFNAEEH